MKRLVVALALVFVPSVTTAAQPQPLLPPPPADVMEIPEELRLAFHREVIDATPYPEARLQRLVAFVFGKRGLGIEYKADATQTVAESFASRKVNCLSSTLLIVALAREAGLHADGQQVDAILAWGATRDTVIQSKHANAVVKVADKRTFIVDVDASDVLARDAPQPISDAQLLALFYGNRAMELMIEGKLVEAKSWIDVATRLSPRDPGLLNNAGVIEFRMGDAHAAERHFLDAVALNESEISVLSNLVSLYRRNGDTARMEVWQSRADRALRKDPYYQYTLGGEFEQEGRYRDALRQYRRAARLNRDEHLFHLGLARVHFRLGEYGKADRELARAREMAPVAYRQRYDSKLAALRRLQSRTN